jgi:hypothetical protein
MDKAYDLKALLKEMKEQGVPLLENAGEDAALLSFKALKKWLKESAVMSENKIDDIAMNYIDSLDAIVLPVIDKIDGEVG